MWTTKSRVIKCGLRPGRFSPDGSCQNTDIILLTTARCKCVSCRRSGWYVFTRRIMSEYILCFLYIVMAISGSWTDTYNLKQKVNESLNKYPSLVKCVLYIYAKSAISSLWIDSTMLSMQH